VFKKFQDCQGESKFYVLACVDQKAVNQENKNREEYAKGEGTEPQEIQSDEEKMQFMIQRLFAMEIFITDFDFAKPMDCVEYKSQADFVKGKKPVRVHSYVKCTLDDFVKYLDDYMFKTNKKYRRVARGSGYGFGLI
jgi:hypothetical protein